MNLACFGRIRFVVPVLNYFVLKQGLYKMSLHANVVGCVTAVVYGFSELFILSAVCC